MVFSDEPSGPQPVDVSRDGRKFGFTYWIFVAAFGLPIWL